MGCLKIRLSSEKIHLCSFQHFDKRTVFPWIILLPMSWYFLCGELFSMSIVLFSHWELLPSEKWVSSEGRQVHRKDHNDWGGNFSSSSAFPSRQEGMKTELRESLVRAGKFGASQPLRDKRWTMRKHLSLFGGIWLTSVPILQSSPQKLVRGQNKISLSLWFVSFFPEYFLINVSTN